MTDVRHQIVELLPRLTRFAYSLTGSQDEAGDLVQAACEKALKALHQFVPGTRLDSWMMRIVQTVWIDQTRAATKRRSVFVAAGESTAPVDARIYEQVEAREHLELIRAEIARLPAEQRIVLALVSVDGMSYQQAANTLGIPVGTVMSRLARARRKLADLIEPTQPAPRSRERLA